MLITITLLTGCSFKETVVENNLIKQDYECDNLICTKDNIKIDIHNSIFYLVSDNYEYNWKDDYGTAIIEDEETYIYSCFSKTISIKENDDIEYDCNTLDILDDYYSSVDSKCSQGRDICSKGKNSYNAIKKYVE